jgi:hypothetical protein
MIDLEQINRDAAGMGASDQNRTLPLEMAVPAILSRIEETHHPPGLRVQAADVRALVAVAEGANTRRTKLTGIDPPLIPR